MSVYPVVPCSAFAQPTPRGEEFVNFIRSSPTLSPQEYDRYCEEHPSQCKLTDGDTESEMGGLGHVVELGNQLLMRHIVQKEGKHLLHLGDTVGRTPLHLAMGLLGDRCLPLVKECLRLGANPNTCNLLGQTALDVSSQLKVSRFLIRRGATGKFSGIDALQYIPKSQLQAERLMLAARFKNPASLLSRIPFELFKVVHGYVLYDEF